MGPDQERIRRKLTWRVVGSELEQLRNDRIGGSEPKEVPHAAVVSSRPGLEAVRPAVAPEGRKRRPLASHTQAGHDIEHKFEDVSGRTAGAQAARWRVRVRGARGPAQYGSPDQA